MERSESIASLAAALVAAQTEVENAHKNATNPHFRSQYADLTEIIATVRPVLNKHGITVVQFPGFADGVATVETVLVHETGEYMAGVSGAPLQKADPQGVGSALTYLRRYSLAAVCGIGQEDDDGNAASDPRASDDHVSKTNGWDSPASDKQTSLIERLANSPALTEEERDGVRSRLMRGMSKRQASDAIEWLNQKVERAKLEGAA